MGDLSINVIVASNMQLTFGNRCSLPVATRRAPRRVTIAVRADGSVQDLLARDRKQPKISPELLGEEGSKSKKQSVVKSRNQRRSDARARTDAPDQPSDRPKRCKDALDKGLEAFKEQKYEQAIELFNLALELPGNGAYRLPGSPREYSCPSEAEERAALYNMACAYAQLGQAASCLTCLEAVLESGFADFPTMRSDPDLAPARGPAFEELLGRYDSPLAKLKKMLPSNKDKQVLVSETNKPWMLW